MAASPRPSRNGRPSGRGSKAYDRKLELILRQAAAVFRTRGYHQASIRDIARATGVSLAGLYYYFSSKDELLYLIQRHAFETILAAARAGLEEIASPEERLRAFIRIHLQFFLEHPNEMKVLTHEEEWLGRERGREVRSIKRAYYQLCFEQVEALRRVRSVQGLNTRLAVLALFGMMNWIYTWYNPKIDPDAADCAEAMAAIFLEGILGGHARTAAHPGVSDASRAASNGHGSGRRPSNTRNGPPANGASAREKSASRRPGLSELRVQD
jgi:TetR/AcrR family transcriptional regulator, cholesterol catabolism regulator